MIFTTTIQEAENLSRDLGTRFSGASITCFCWGLTATQFDPKKQCQPKKLLLWADEVYREAVTQLILWPAKGTHLGIKLQQKVTALAAFTNFSCPKKTLLNEQIKPNMNTLS